MDAHNAHDLLVRSLQTHSRLGKQDIREIAGLPHELQEFQPGEDFIHQGEAPKVAALVVSGMVARYHILSSGRRQYVSFHIAGDLPDVQALFLREMDHSVCAMGTAIVAFVPHRMLMRAFTRRPSFAFAIWRETLIDAAIFREAITNNGARSNVAGMAHLFCELFYRAREAGLNDGMTWEFPVNLTQLGETLAMAIATVHRTLHELRATHTVDLRVGKLVVKDWTRLVKIGEFDPGYLHTRDPLNAAS
ncbi:Crp/Fnr family transcriptional regulator [Bradyrhizobium macuxiense]|uniref:Crp/Fnr family transcriptional regulator n=1 Tax=Bradyrhizobium macuxiense TaxID=1755647 RepID=A0A109JX83_9BRAD|nr:Crp/Fnr family transcriptional regulator [Bradyrhizobium macuxiense]KWV56783.1 Crp/Fnr family transcriptional regulator [Bradyrhizobium macuxiense]